MCLFLSFLATSVGVYHVRAHSDLRYSIPPFVIASGLLSAAVIIIGSKWAKKIKVKLMEKRSGNEEQGEDLHKPEPKDLV